MANKVRGDSVVVGDSVTLKMKLSNAVGENVKADIIPSIGILNAAGEIAVGPTNEGVFVDDDGFYCYTIDGVDKAGMWKDTWLAIMRGKEIVASFSFNVKKAKVKDSYVN